MLENGNTLAGVKPLKHNLAIATILVAIGVVVIAFLAYWPNVGQFSADLENRISQCPLVYRCSGICACNDGTSSVLLPGLFCGADAHIPDVGYSNPNLCSSNCSEHGGVNPRKTSIGCNLVLRNCERTGHSPFVEKEKSDADPNEMEG